MTINVAIIGDGGVGSLALRLAAQRINEPALYIIQHRNDAERTKICHLCGSEVLINKPSGNGFCIGCDYRITPETKEQTKIKRCSI